jgi:hypothetical protein
MKLLRTLILSLSLISIGFHSQESKAAVGLVAAPALISAGVVLTALGGAGTVAICKNASGDAGLFVAGLVFFITLPMAAIGLVLLDGEQTMQYASLSIADAKKLSLSSYEHSAYNSEIDQLNNHASYVQEEVSRDGKATAEEAADVWGQVKDTVSVDAFNAFVKVNKQFVKIK